MYPKSGAAKYTIVDDGSSSSSSSAEARDSMALDKMEKQSLMGQMRQVLGLRERIGSRCGGLWAGLTGPWMTSLLLALANMLLVLAIIGGGGGGGGGEKRPETTYKHWLPPENTMTSLFTFQTLYGQDLNDESEAAWNALMPIGRGFVIIKNDTAIPDQPGLFQSVAQQKAMVSVFHQLHCLYMTREGYYSALAGRPAQVSSAHLMHCFDYLRQTIMCFADTTLEWLPPPPRDNGSTGWGFEHKCRDYGAVARWVEQNRLKTTHGIH